MSLFDLWTLLRISQGCDLKSRRIVTDRVVASGNTTLAETSLRSSGVDDRQRSHTTRSRVVFKTLEERFQELSEHSLWKGIGQVFLSLDPAYRASGITRRWRTPSRPGTRQRKQPSKMLKHGVVSFPVGCAGPKSDTYHRVPAKLAHRKSIATIHPCDSGVRPACSTFPSDSHALPSTASILNVPQSARLQDRQCGHHGCL